MEPPHKGPSMRNGADLKARRRSGRSPNETVPELPMVTALLIAAVAVAVMAAGGPVLDLLSGLAALWSS